MIFQQMIGTLMLNVIEKFTQPALFEIKGHYVTVADKKYSVYFDRTSECCLL